MGTPRDVVSSTTSIPNHIEGEGGTESAGYRLVGSNKTNSRASQRMESHVSRSRVHWDPEPGRSSRLVPRGAFWSAAALRRFRAWRAPEKRHGTGALQNLRKPVRVMGGRCDKTDHRETEKKRKWGG